jgi:preprotein translocase subunit SecG
MYQVIIVIHVLLGLGIIGLVLMQQGKGADAGAAFGAGASGSVFGAQGAASFLSRSTAILATLFFLTSLGLAILNSHKGAAYDLMSETATEKDTLAIPDVEGAKKADSAPVNPPVSTTAEKPVETEKAAVSDIKAAETPNVEETKALEKSSAPVSDAKKEPVKK